MTAALIDHTTPAQQLALHIEIATARIAPTWPLDRMIAVNPYWGWVAQPMAAAAAELGTLGGTRLTMPREWFHAQWRDGKLQRAHLLAAVMQDPVNTRTGTAAQRQAQAEAEAKVDELVAALEMPNLSLPRLPLVTDLRDAGTPPQPGQSWTGLVTHQISQHCAAFFDQDQAAWGMDPAPGLYNSWRGQLAADHGLPWRQGRAALRHRLVTLPAAPRDLISAALHGMAMPEAGRTAYLGAVLLAIGGWGAWCAHDRWQARLQGSDADTVEQLLAIRLAWEWLLFDEAPPDVLSPGWGAAWGRSDETAGALQQAQSTDWLLQTAAEIAYQQPLIRGLGQQRPAAKPAAPAVQALFCIDVRSEVFRRALEGASPRIQTRGFAGFFGLPIAYAPLGSALERPQLPGLLAPAYRVTESAGDTGLGQVLATKRRGALQWRQRWTAFKAAPSSAFSFVESLGLAYGAKLLVESMLSATDAARWEDTGLPAAGAAALRPCLPLTSDDPSAAATLACRILGAMGLVRDFAPLVLIAGHGSTSANNPQAAGLDCGACGGQSGDVNARVLADLLNDVEVRHHMREQGIDLPAATHFVPALHNTTTDEVRLFDTEAVPDPLQAELTQLRGWLATAGTAARAERADSLGLAALGSDDRALKDAVQKRGNDWAQVRPEWGLANNAAFIVAPRSRSQHLDLAGRAFLHDYDHRLDPTLGVLTLIMTAPMVVTHWINMQYNASTVDNQRYGSGNKLLHNVVGGHIGVFEGNGGDLRIGLPMQSLHDGQHLRHTPLRLSVFIEAPRTSIDSVTAAHETVRHLVGNAWLHLFRIDPESGAVEQCRNGNWTPAPDCETV